MKSEKKKKAKKKKKIDFLKDFKKLNKKPIEVPRKKSFVPPGQSAD